MPFCVSARVVAVLYICAILQAQCRSLYRHPLTCEPGEYYNRATHHCEGCGDLCQPQRDTLAQCSQLCPGYQITPIPDTPLTTIEPTSPPVADMKKKNEDEELESVWQGIYGLAAALIVAAPVLFMLVFCVIQQQKQLTKLLDPGERQQAVGKPTEDTPIEAAPANAPPTKATPPEVQPLLTEPGKPVPEEGDEVPTAPSSKVPIYANDTTPHDRCGHGTSPKTHETVC